MPIKFITHDQKLDTWILSQQTLKSLIKCEEQAFASQKITYSQFMVLMAITLLPAPVIAVDLANWLDCEANTVTTILDRMTKNGLIARARDSEDRRTIQIIITPEGKRVFQPGQELYSEVISEILADFSADEIRFMIKTLRKIQEKTFFLRGLKNKVV